jgi:hypothetical protein
MIYIMNCGMDLEIKRKPYTNANLVSNVILRSTSSVYHKKSKSQPILKNEFFM